MKVQGVKNYHIYPKLQTPNKSNYSSAATKQQQSSGISNVYYTPFNFKKRWSEHQSWGAVIDPKSKNATFKLLSFPDNKVVYVEITDSKTCKPYIFEMHHKKDGIYESGIVPAKYARHDNSYRYIIERADGTIEKVKDPYSFRQKELLGKSVLYDHSLFKWNDDNWYRLNRERVSRKKNASNDTLSVSDLRIYELNTKTLNKKGSFEGVKDELKRIKELGFNAIEIMPVENTYSFNWGYDGIDKFAPPEHLGGPDGLKDLINFAHNIGINVIIDMVPNHFGPDGNSLSKTGPYIKGPNSFGDAINYEGENSKYVRDFIINAAINWIHNYHADGLRLDMTKFMESDYTMKQLSAEINYHLPEAFLIAEDGRTNVKVDDEGNWFANAAALHDERVTNPLSPAEYGNSSDEAKHENAINKIAQHAANVSLAALGYDSEWDFVLYHELKEALYNNGDLDILTEAMKQSGNRVKYLMSHDEIGNYDGTRLVSKLMVPMLNLTDSIILNEQDYLRAQQRAQLKNQSYEEALNIVKNQKAQLTCEKLLTKFLCGELDKYIRSDLMYYWLEPAPEEFINEILLPLGIKGESNISAEQIREMYLRSSSSSRAAIALIYAIPGPKMIFQGDESLDITPFRFFRELESNKNDQKNLYIEKGYDTGKKGLEESTLGRIKYSDFAKDKMSKYLKMVVMLNKLSQENPAMNEGCYIVEDTVKHYQSKLIGMHTKAKNADNELFTITNFAAEQYPREDCDRYKINFPKGKWIEILNTDDKEFGGHGYINTRIVSSDGVNQVPINIGKYSTLIFKKIG